MKKVILVIAFCIGAGVTLFALSAPLFGFDRDNDWGAGRVILLGGGLLFLAAGLVYVCWPFVERIFTRISAWFNNLPPVRKYRAFVLSARKSIQNHPFSQKINNTRLVKYFAGSQERQSGLASAIAVTLVLVAYTWLVSVGTWTHWPEKSDYYQQLADAFRHGQTYLLTEPNAELLALDNPYDVDSHLKAGHPWDVVFYDGHFYLYWGPVPALVVLLMQAFYKGVIGDQVLVFFFSGGAFLLLVLVLLDVRSKLFNSIGWKLVFPAVLVLGFANPLPWILNRPQVYEAAIMGGQFFLAVAIFCGWHALRGKNPHPWLLAISGLSLSLALGSRVSLVFVGLFLQMVFIIGALKRSENGTRLRVILSGGLPFLAGLAGMGLYNYVRFGSFIEFGHRYQLTGMNLYLIYEQVVSPANIFPNLHNYLLNPVRLLDVFPFFKPNWGGQFIFFPIKTPAEYYAEQISGFFITSPLGIFAFVPALMVIWDRFSPKAGPKHENGELTPWLALALTGVALLAFGPLILFIVSSMRYLADFVPVAMLLSVLGWWMVVVRFEKSPGKKGVAIFAGVLLALLTIISGLLLGITGYISRFEVLNPALFDFLTRLLTP